MATVTKKADRVEVEFSVSCGGSWGNVTLKLETDEWQAMDEGQIYKRLKEEMEIDIEDTTFFDADNCIVDELYYEEEEEDEDEEDDEDE